MRSVVDRTASLSFPRKVALDQDGPIVGQSLTLSAPSGVGGLDRTKLNGFVLVDLWTPRLYA